MRCGHCGEPLPPGALFCGECGRAAQPEGTGVPRGPRVSIVPPAPAPAAGARVAAPPPRPPVAPTVILVPPVGSAEPFAEAPDGEPEGTVLTEGAPVEPAPVPEVHVPDVDEEPTTVSPRRVRPVVATVVASTGQRFQVSGRALLGRRPTPAAGESYDAVLVIVDEGKTVSKTHLELIVDAERVRVVDLGSGNGTVVEAPGEPSARCVPGVPLTVPRGSRLVLGRQFLIVS